MVDYVDETGRRTKIEVRQVPDDLQQRADFSPMAAGGPPKDEARMTEAEKKRRLQRKQPAQEDK